MTQWIRYRNRDKGIKLGDPMTENHGLDIKILHPKLLM
jgi:hypothetical protein